jgi:hypothetical protein
MPIHDWSRVDAGIFHHFHQSWTIEISNALNAGILPSGFFALAEQIISGPIPDVVTLQRKPPAAEPRGPSGPMGGGIAVADAPPKARFIRSAEADVYAQRANRVVIRHSLGDVIAVIEIVSPGNKSSRHAFRAFVEKAEQLLGSGIHLLVVDLFPPTPRDPQGIHQAIWSEISDDQLQLPADKPLTVVSYLAAEPKRAYVEPIAAGDSLPTLPIFLDAATYVPAPLEQTYQLAWSKCPQAVRELVSGSA